MPTRNVVLGQHQQDLVESMVSSGRYQNASEVLRAAGDVGWADIAAGRYRDIAADDLDAVIGQLAERAARISQDG